MIYGSVCSGIEAASVAWHPLGWKASFVSEIDNFPRAVLAHHYPEVPLHGDFTTIQDGDYEPINILVGGTPCQSFSVAGLRGGLDDDRGNLALEFLKLAQRLRPRWVVWENVPGVLSSNGGRDFGSILAGLGEVGYGFAYRVLDAQYFGLAQRRKRVFVVGYLGDWRRAAAVLFEREGLRGDTAPRRGAGERIANCLGVSPASSSSPNIGNGQGNVVEVRAFDVLNHTTDDVAHTLSARADMQVGCVFPTYEVAGPLTAGMHKGPRGTEAVDSNHLVAGVSVPYETLTFSSEMSEPSWGVNISETLKTTCPPAVAFATHEVAGTMKSCASSGGFSNSIDHAAAGYMAIAKNSAVRRLTPIECERLQGFPDGYTDIPYRGKPAADGPRYKALGNSMAVPCMRWIGERIQMVEDLPC